MPGIINNPAVALYVAMAVALVVMIGFFIYLWTMDRQVRELQRALQAREQVAVDPTLPVEAERPARRPQHIDKELSNGLDRP